MWARRPPGFVREQCFWLPLFAFSVLSRRSVVADRVWRSATPRESGSMVPLLSRACRRSGIAACSLSPRRIPQQGGTPRRAPPPRQDQARAFAVCARERVSWGPASRLPGPPALYRCGTGMLRREGCTPWGYGLCRYFVLR